MTWRVLLRSINGLVNKVNVSNIKSIVLDLFKQDLLRGRGVLVRSLMKAQLASPTFTRVYAAVVSVVNCKLPEIGELLLKRVLHQFRRHLLAKDLAEAAEHRQRRAQLMRGDGHEVALDAIEVREAALVVSGTTDAYDAALEKPVVGSRLAALNGESCVGEAPDVVMERLRNASRPLELEFWSRGKAAS